MNDLPAGYSDGSKRPQSPGGSPFALRSPFAEYYRPPRLGVIHLLAWTAATAVLLKFSLAMQMIGEASGQLMPPAPDVFQQALNFVYSTAHAAGIVGACTLLLAKVRRLPGRLQPGHWLVLIATVISLLWLLCWGLYLLAFATGFVDYFSSMPWILAAYGFVAILCAGMYSYTTLASKDGKRWKISFATLATVNLLRGLSHLGDSFFDSPWSLFSFPLGSLIVALALLVTVVVDLRRGPHRDWLHWVGVAIIATHVLLNVAWWLWAMFAAELAV